MTKVYAFLLLTHKTYCMRKVVFLMSVLLSFIFCEKAFAQLNVTAAIEEKPEKLLVGQVSYSWLYKTGTGDYEYWARTDNQFDKHYTSLFLGNTPQTAVQTLNDLLSLMNRKVAIVNVQQLDGDITLKYANQLGVKMLWMKQVGQGGKSWISYPIVEKFIKYFKENFPNEFLDEEKQGEIQ